MDPLLNASTELSLAVLALGLLTAAFAALAARIQTDIKSALSFASLTQVGLIVAEIGLGWRYIPLVHLIGHACLRTLQFVRAPSVIRDHHAIENAVGDRLPRSAAGWLGGIGVWVYRFGLERGYLDAFFDRFLVSPFCSAFRWFSSLEVRATNALNGVDAPAASPSKEDRPA